MQKQYKSNNTNRNASKKHKHQKLYKMRGCNKSSRKRGGHLGGSNIATMFTTSHKAVSADLNLAYPYKGPIVQNTAFAYTGKGGNRAENSNPNGANPLYPNTGPPIGGFNFLNPVNQQVGGGCGCGGLPFMGGGGGSHREDCRCSSCKESKPTSTSTLMNGGGGCTTGNNGIPYPNGLVGKPYENPTNLPGANGVTGGANYYSNNTYNNDVSRQMLDVGANRPFLGLKGGKSGKRSKRKHNSNKKTTKQRGGFLADDLINLGRQFGHGMGNALNALNGYPASPSPLPWKDQLMSKY
jgi:hypothetical protein